MSNSFSNRKDMKNTNGLLPNHLTTNSTRSSTPLKKAALNSYTSLRKFLSKRFVLPTFILVGIFLFYANSFILTAEDVAIKKKSNGWKGVGAEIGLGNTLETRLRDWETSPLMGLEPSDWVAFSTKTCPASRITPNQNRSQLEQSHLLWSGMNSSLIGDLRIELIGFLRKAEADGKMSEKAWGTGRGLVFTAGNSDTFHRVLVTLKLLNKHLNTHLPVEIFSFPGEIPSDEIRKELEGFGAKFLVVEDAIKDPTKTKSYHIKATAIIRSSFREVLYLDSDNLPTAGLSPLEPGQEPSKGEIKWGDTAGLWEAKSYKRLGVMLWSDYWRTGADNPIWAIIGVGCRDEWEQESGQILIDKALHLDALLLSEYMMDTSRFKFWMNFSDGDKDIFRYCFLALRKRWGVPGRYVGVGAFPSDTMSGFGGHTMLQHDHVGRPLFVHANLLKQIPSGIGPGYAWGKTKSLALPSSQMIYPRGNHFMSDSASDLVDHDVDCDQLANADLEGNAIRPAGPAVRRRAVMERGMAAFWHGGWRSALCIDMSYKDTRTLSDLAEQRALLTLNRDPNAVDPNSHPATDDDIRPKITRTSDGMELYWGDSALGVREWSDDVRLRDFERVFFEEGGILSANGF